MHFFLHLLMQERANSILRGTEYKYLKITRRRTIPYPISWELLLVTVSIPRVFVLMMDVRGKKLGYHFTVSDAISFGGKTWKTIMVDVWKKRESTV